MMIQILRTEPWTGVSHIPVYFAFAYSSFSCVRGRLWKQTADYFPQRLVKTADLPADRNYLVGYHPHGVISLGAGAAFGSDALGGPTLFPGIKQVDKCFALSLPALLRNYTVLAVSRVRGNVVWVSHAAHSIGTPFFFLPRHFIFHFL